MPRLWPPPGGAGTSWGPIPGSRATRAPPEPRGAQGQLPNSARRREASCGAPRPRCHFGPNLPPSASPHTLHSGPAAPTDPSHAANLLKDVLRSPNLHGAGGLRGVPAAQRGKEAAPAPDLPPRLPLVAQRARAVGPDAGTSRRGAPALSRPGLGPGLPRGATKPRPLAPGARRRSSGQRRERREAVVLRRRGRRPAPSRASGQADLWAALGPAQRAPGRPAHHHLASRGLLTAAQRMARTGLSP